MAEAFSNINVAPVPPFDPNGDASSIYQRWTRWLRGFEIFADASGCTVDRQKRQLLLHCAGLETQEIFFTFPAPILETYAATAGKLTEYFKPAKNVPYNRHNFRQAKQEDHENMAQFVTRLKQLAVDCDFGDKLDENVRDQVIDKCSNSQIRTRLLAESDLTLAKCLTLAAAKEMSEQQSQDIGGEKAFSLRHKKSSHTTSPLQCTRCGEGGHQSDDCKITRNQTCHECGYRGHFASQCFSKGKKKEGKVPDEKLKKKHKRKSKSKPLRFVEEREGDSESSEEYAFAVGSNNEKVKVYIEGEPVSMIVDSGASVNILNTNAAIRLKKAGVQFEKCKKTIQPYGSPSITAVQMIRAKIRLEDGENMSAEFLVIQGEQPSLLGRKTSEALGVLRIGVNFVESTVLDSYPGITDGIGQLKDFEVKIHVDPSVTPVARKHSRIPFHLRSKVKEELDKLERQDIIEKVDSKDATEWVSRIVVAPKPKKPNEIRLCVDMREANKAIQRTRHVTPTVEEIISDLNGAKFFSKVDLKAGYHQLTLNKSSRSITTFSTHDGLYRYKRLSFGINSAAEIFQHTIQTVIADLEGAKNVSDDIIVYGRDIEEHDRNLHKLLSTLQKAGLTVNRAKCEFRKSEIEFYGFVFSADGLRPDPAKVEALKQAQEPKNSSEVRSFLGMAQYSARFIPKFATITEPLRQLTRHETPWTWGDKETSAFNAVKEALCKSATLAYFDMKKQPVIVVDASPVGVAGLLMQDGKTVCYASRALSNVEQRYSQTEREALAIVWACEHFDLYVRGTNFKVITDHRPLVTIWDKPSPPARIARWSLRLQPYSMKVEYRPGKDNPADYLSRHPTTNCPSGRAEKVAEEFINFITITNTPNAVTTEEIKMATTQDATLQVIIDTIETGNWHTRPETIPHDTFQAFKNANECLSVNGERNIILKNNLIVIPECLQSKVIQLAHEGHQGIHKTKALLRSKVWFPNMTTKAESVVKSCIPCQANTNRTNIEPLSMSSLPSGPWKKLSLDFCGPLPSGDTLMVMQDEYSRYPVVEILRKTTVESVIPVVDKIFSEFGFPKEIKTDNGPQFKSSVWREYMKECGIKHRRITPLWPRANAQAETFNKPLMKAIRAATVQKQNWKQAMYKFLRMYRATPHCTTQFSPFFLLFGREPRTKMPELSNSSHPRDDEVRERDALAKDRMKRAADKRNNAKHHDITRGDVVLIKQPKLNKLSTPYLPKPLRVQQNKGTMVTVARPDGSTITRNASQFKLLPPTTEPAKEDVDEDIDEEIYKETNKEVIVEAQISPNKQLVTSVPIPQSPREQKQPRTRKAPKYLQDYVQ